MFFYLSKTIYFFFMPLGWITLSLLGYIFLKSPRWKRISGIMSVVLLLIFTNPFLSNEAIRLWEFPPVSLETLDSYELAIVLTGVSDNSRQPADRVYFNKGADRVTHTVQLYKLGKVKKILISGGSGSFTEGNFPESVNLKRAFVLMGVREEDISLETTSKNTYQSAQNVKNQLKESLPNSTLLVTSSFHMRRAKACFDKADITTTAFPTDFYASVRRFTPDAWIPSAGAMVKWSVVFREIIGTLAYRVMGYI